MIKSFSIFAALTAVMLLWASASFAAVGIRVNGAPYGTATDLNLSCGAGVNSVVTQDGSNFNLECSSTLSTSGIANGGAVSIASTVTAVPVSYAFVRKVLDSDGNAAFTAGTLANGTPGQVLTIFASGMTPSGATTGGNFTITPSTTTGFRSIKLSAIGDVVSLLYIDDFYGWVILTYDPAAANSITVTLKN